MISNLIIFHILGSFTESEFKIQDSTDEEILKMNFSNYIRAGKDDRVKQLLKQHKMVLLNTCYTFQVNIKKKNIHSQDELTNPNTATLEVSPLHLAIISKQGSCLEVLLREIESIQNHEPTNITYANRFLEAKVVVEFPLDNAALYNDEERMLDGMNILHLAAKYYSEGLEKIICFSQTNKRIFKLVKETLLIGVDNQIRNTPFHVAASAPNVNALRYIFIMYYTNDP